MKEWIKEKIKRHPIAPFVIGIFVWLLMVIGGIQILSMIEISNKSGLHFVSSAGYWIALISAILPYAGTCFIGIIAMWQNQKLSNINEYMMNMEKAKLIPIIHCKRNKVKHKSGKLKLYFQLEHKGGNMARSIVIKNIIVNRGDCEQSVGDMKLKKDLYIGDTIWEYVECEDIGRLEDDIVVTFDLTFDDISGESYVLPKEISWVWRGDFDRNRAHYSDSERIEFVATNANT